MASQAIVVLWPLGGTSSLGSPQDWHNLSKGWDIDSIVQAIKTPALSIFSTESKLDGANNGIWRVMIKAILRTYDILYFFTEPVLRPNPDEEDLESIGITFWHNNKRSSRTVSMRERARSCFWTVNLLQLFTSSGRQSLGRLGNVLLTSMIGRLHEESIFGGTVGKAGSHTFSGQCKITSIRCKFYGTRFSRTRRRYRQRIWQSVGCTGYLRGAIISTPCYHF